MKKTILLIALIGIVLAVLAVAKDISISTKYKGRIRFLLLTEM